MPKDSPFSGGEKLGSMPGGRTSIKPDCMDLHLQKLYATHSYATGQITDVGTMKGVNNHAATNKINSAIDSLAELRASHAHLANANIEVAATEHRSALKREQAKMWLGDQESDPVPALDGLSNISFVDAKSGDDPMDLKAILDYSSGIGMTGISSGKKDDKDAKGGKPKPSLKSLIRDGMAAQQAQQGSPTTPMTNTRSYVPDVITQWRRSYAGQLPSGAGGSGHANEGATPSSSGNNANGNRSFRRSTTNSRYNVSFLPSDDEDSAPPAPSGDRDSSGRATLSRQITASSIGDGQASETSGSGLRSEQCSPGPYERGRAGKSPSIMARQSHFEQEMQELLGDGFDPDDPDARPWTSASRGGTSRRSARDSEPQLMTKAPPSKADGAREKEGEKVARGGTPEEKGPGEERPGMPTREQNSSRKRLNPLADPAVHAALRAQMDADGPSDAQKKKEAHDMFLAISKRGSHAGGSGLTGGGEYAEPRLPTPDINTFDLDRQDSYGTIPQQRVLPALPGMGPPTPEGGDGRSGFSRASRALRDFESIRQQNAEELAAAAAANAAANSPKGILQQLTKRATPKRGSMSGAVSVEPLLPEERGLLEHKSTLSRRSMNGVSTAPWEAAQGVQGGPSWAANLRSTFGKSDSLIPSDAASPSTSSPRPNSGLQRGPSGALQLPAIAAVRQGGSLLGSSSAPSSARGSPMSFRGRVGASAEDSLLNNVATGGPMSPHPPKGGTGLNPGGNRSFRGSMGRVSFAGGPDAPQNGMLPSLGASPSARMRASTTGGGEDPLTGGGAGGSGGNRSFRSRVSFAGDVGGGLLGGGPADDDVASMASGADGGVNWRKTLAAALK